ncbi:MAG: dihydropteroate synthase [Clostridia bacterium]|nr:dihydropteroate synthase [Clostridia bacterium]
MKIGNKTFDKGTHVMAIVNLTPDSFYEGSRATADNVLARVEKAIKDGASVIDIGGQSTRPSYVAVSAQEELSVIRISEPTRHLRRS